MRKPTTLPWRRDSTTPASGKPGAVQGLLLGANETSLELVLKPVRVAMDVEGNAVVKDAVKDGRGDHAIPDYRRLPLFSID